VTCSEIGNKTYRQPLRLIKKNEHDKTMQIEILTNKNIPLTIEIQSKEIKELLQKIQQKYPDWEEFILSNHKTKQIRVLKLGDKVTFLNKILEIGNLIVFLDKNYFNWIRFGVSRREFPIIEDFVYSKGMLLREFGSNTNTYQFVKEINGDIVTLFQEGKEWKYSIENHKKNGKNKFKLLCENLVNDEEFLNFEFPERK